MQLAIGQKGVVMRNPWTKKNPLLSMWLSGANAVAGSARSRMLAASRRHAVTMMTQGTKQVLDFWTGGWARPVKKKKRAR
jgi:hypothetical protein